MIIRGGSWLLSARRYAAAADTLEARELADPMFTRAHRQKLGLVYN